ncbi:succinylglutamate desuccinylase/aspartoacylase family protein [Sphingomicrobium flavum]|uniref:succinylglutamate desuccinylase/aspartoacylase family protein n=1 Tax=Sphingomicrobium flavum TaxID=1229164 RepID=UPI0021ADCA59|nr:succinylglutamate desuccinylase/aspartoacylase family protein [Sphingomicrobium flavum]
MSASPFTIYGETIASGKRGVVNIPVSRDAADRWVYLPVRVIHGASPGPVLFVSAAVHGDEIIGVEIIRRLLKKISPSKLAGTLIAVPVVNAYGFVAHSRYLPDRRDLNRSFPGREEGSLAGRLAFLFRSEIVERADFGIDLHSAAVHRYNLPQIRVSRESERALELARAFAPPIIMASNLREGSLRAMALEKGVEMMLYEAGEALRFDPLSIRMGLNGILRVMAEMGMIELKRGRDIAPSLEASRSIWLRAPRGGISDIRRPSGKIVFKGDLLAMVRNPLGNEEMPIRAPMDGLVIGHSRMGAVHRGDALLHVAQLGDGEGLDPETEERLNGPMLDEHEVV